MKKIVILSFLFVSSFIFISASSSRSDKPSQPQVKLKEVKIGNQIWSAENLKVDKFKNGDPIPHARNKRQWKKAAKNKQPAWCYYGMDPYHEGVYGKLYNWYAVTDSRGLCPDGWQIPTSEDWDILIEHLGGKSQAGHSMKGKGTWKDNGSGSNKSKFDGRPGGVRNADGIFSFKDSYGKWWSSSAPDATNAWCQYLYHGYKMSLKELLNKGYGLSVRCVKYKKEKEKAN